MLLATKISSLVSTPWVETYHTLTFLSSKEEPNLRTKNFCSQGLYKSLLQETHWWTGKIIGHMTQWDDYKKHLCIYNKLWRFELISPVGQKVKGGKGSPTKAWRLLFLPTITSLESIKSFVFTHQNKHFLLAKTDKHYFGFLKATDCKYLESIHNYKILLLILFS